MLTLVLSLTGEKEEAYGCLRDVLAQEGLIGKGTRLGELALEVCKAPLPVSTDPNCWMELLSRVAGARGLVTRDAVLKMFKSHALKMFI